MPSETRAQTQARLLSEGGPQRWKAFCEKRKDLKLLHGMDGNTAHATTLDLDEYQPIERKAGDERMTFRGIRVRVQKAAIGRPRTASLKADLYWVLERLEAISPEDAPSMTAAAMHRLYSHDAKSKKEFIQLAIPRLLSPSQGVETEDVAQKADADYLERLKEMIRLAEEKEGKNGDR